MPVTRLSSRRFPLVHPPTFGVNNTDCSSYEVSGEPSQGSHSTSGNFLPITHLPIPLPCFMLCILDPVTFALLELSSLAEYLFLVASYECLGVHCLRCTPTCKWLCSFLHLPGSLAGKSNFQSAWGGSAPPSSDPVSLSRSHHPQGSENRSLLWYGCSSLIMCCGGLGNLEISGLCPWG